LKAGRHWFAHYAQEAVKAISLVPDWSFHIDPEADITPIMQGLVKVASNSTKWQKMKFSEQLYEYFSQQEHYIHGFRIVATYVDALISVQIKPKIRYKAFRQTLELALHMCKVNNGGYNIEATGPMGNIVF
jgi:hypothetical protein